MVAGLVARPHHVVLARYGRSIVFMSNRGPNLDRGASLMGRLSVDWRGGLRRLTHSTFEDADPD